MSHPEIVSIKIRGQPRRRQIWIWKGLFKSSNGDVNVINCSIWLKTSPF